MSETQRKPKSRKRKPITIAQVADIIGSALYVAQTAGLKIDFRNLGDSLALKISGLSAVVADGEMSVMPLQESSINATTKSVETEEMPLQVAV